MPRSKKFLSNNFSKEWSYYFGIKKSYADSISNIWHNDIEYTQRWKEVENFNDHKGKILDMACGVGTFMFNGLRRGYDVYGIEPEDWKLEYIKLKIKEQNLPKEWEKRFIKGIGENLPFEDNTFDYIITYQTLEHVQNVEKCIDEMLRVLKKRGGQTENSSTRL